MLKDKILQQAGAAEIGLIRRKDGKKLGFETIETWKKIVAFLPEGMEDGPSILAYMQDKGIANSTMRTWATVLRQFGVKIHIPKEDSDYEPFTLPPEWVNYFMERPSPSGFATYQKDLRYESGRLMLKIGINSCLRPVDLLNVGVDNLFTQGGKTYFAIRHLKTGKIVKSPIHPVLMQDLKDARAFWDGKSFFHPSLRCARETGRKISSRSKRDFLRDVLKKELGELAYEQVFVNGEISTYQEQVQAKCLRPSGANWYLSNGHPIQLVEKIGGWTPGSKALRRHYINPNIDIY